MAAEIDEVRQMKSLHPSRASSFYSGTPRPVPLYQYEELQCPAHLLQQRVEQLPAASCRPRQPQPEDFFVPPAPDNLPKLALPKRNLGEGQSHNFGSSQLQPDPQLDQQSDQQRDQHTWHPSQQRDQQPLHNLEQPAGWKTPLNNHPLQQPS